MYRSSLRMCLGASAVTFLVLSATTTASAQDAEIEQVITAFLVPFSNQNIDEFIEFFADDATAFFPAARFSPVRVEGKAAIATTFAAVFKPGGLAPDPKRPAIQPQNLKVQRFGDSAIVTFHLGFDAARGRRTFVLRRIGSNWKIAHLHASTITQ